MRKIRSLAMECNSLLDKLEECTQNIDSTSNRKEKKKCQIEVSQMKSEIKQKAFEFMSALLDDKAVRWAFSVRLACLDDCDCVINVDLHYLYDCTA